MITSESQTSEAGQHFLECGTVDCEKNCQFYCNPCHRPLCEQCRHDHLTRQDSKSHEVVLYLQRNHQLPVEKCRDHPTKDLDILCNECNVPLCSKCSTMEEHWGHRFVDLETIYSNNCLDCQGKILRIQEYFIPTTKALQNGVRDDATEIKTVVDDIRTTIKAEAESIKSLVDVVASEKIDYVNKIEEMLKENLKKEDNSYNDYISYLNKLVLTFHEYLSSTEFQNNPMIFPIAENLKIEPIPEATEPVPPVFTAGQYSKEDVVKLLGSVNVSNTKQVNRKMPTISNTCTRINPTGEQMEQEKQKCEVKQAMKLSFVVNKVKECKVPDIEKTLHISVDTFGKLWASDWDGNLIQTDLQGNRLQNIKTGEGLGYHTVTGDGDLIYADKNKKVINRINLNHMLTEFIKTGDWEPISIYASHINGDILMGLKMNEKAKIARYIKTGKKIQNIQRDMKGQDICSDPHYITENTNGDICISDYKKQAVVVVNRSGQHKFSYTGLKSEFCPFGICTDALGHILVCDDISSTVHLLDQDGGFLILLLTSHHGIEHPCCLCVDYENNLYVGEDHLNTVTVYKYLQ